MAPITEDRIAARSYRIWEREGRPDGRDQEHWFRAREELEDEAAQLRTATKERRSADGPKPSSQSEQFLRILRAG